MSQWILECFLPKSEWDSSKKIYPKLLQTDMHSEPSKTCSLGFFTKLQAVTYFRKKSILDIWQSSYHK